MSLHQKAAVFDDDDVPKPPASQRVLASDAKARIAGGEFVPDDELTQLGLGRAYRSAKGEVLQTWPGRKFALLSEREALRSWWIALNAHADANRGGRSVAADLPGGPQFVEQIPTLLEELPALLGVDPKRLDYSVASMRAVDAAINRRRRERRLVKRLFGAVVAYVGEIVRRHVGGTWRTWQPAEHWSPLVARPDGLTFDPLAISKPWLERQPLATTVWLASEGMGAWRDHEAQARRHAEYAERVERETPDEVRALGQMTSRAPDVAATALVSRLLAHEDPVVRCTAIGRATQWSLPPSFGGRPGTVFTPHAVPAAVEMLETEIRPLLRAEAPSVRAAALQWLFAREARLWLLAQPAEELSGAGHAALDAGLRLSEQASTWCVEVLEHERDASVCQRLRGVLMRASPVPLRARMIVGALSDGGYPRQAAQQELLSLDDEDDTLGALIEFARTQPEPVQIDVVTMLARGRVRGTRRGALRAWHATESSTRVQAALEQALSSRAGKY